MLLHFRLENSGRGHQISRPLTPSEPQHKPPPQNRHSPKKKPPHQVHHSQHQPSTMPVPSHHHGKLLF